MRNVDYQTLPGDVQLTNESAHLLMTTARWAKFLAVFGFIAYGLLIIATVAGAAAVSSGYMGANYPFRGNPWGLAVSVIILAVVYFFPLYFLLRFASKTQRAFRTNDTYELTEGFHSLKNYYVFIGVLLLITIFFVIINMLLAIFHSGCC